MRTLNLMEMHTDWTGCQSIRNNAVKWVVDAIGGLGCRFACAVRSIDSDNGSGFINHTVWPGSRITM